jgi:hypothetical protein
MLAFYTRFFATLFLGALSLAACGGGGGSTPPMTPPSQSVQSAQTALGTKFARAARWLRVSTALLDVRREPLMQSCTARPKLQGFTGVPSA